MLVTDDAKYGSIRSKVDLAAMSKQEPTSVASSAKQSVIKEQLRQEGPVSQSCAASSISH